LLIWRGRWGFQPDPTETGFGLFWIGADRLVIVVGFGVLGCFIISMVIWFGLWSFEIHYRLIEVHPLFVLIVWGTIFFGWLVKDGCLAMIVGLCNEGGDMGCNLFLLVSLGVAKKQRKTSSFNRGLVRLNGWIVDGGDQSWFSVDIFELR
jgi:hypothetical protein